MLQLKIIPVELSQRLAAVFCDKHHILDSQVTNTGPPYLGLYAHDHAGQEAVFLI